MWMVATTVRTIASDSRSCWRIWMTLGPAAPLVARIAPKSRSKDRGVGRAVIADSRPVNDLVTRGADPRGQVGRQVHVQQEFHDWASGISCSSKTPRGAGQRVADILLLEVRVRRQDFITRAPGCQQSDHRTDGDTKPANAGLAAHDGWVASNPQWWGHICLPPLL